MIENIEKIWRKQTQWKTYNPSDINVFFHNEFGYSVATSAFFIWAVDICCQKVSQYQLMTPNMLVCQFAHQFCHIPLIVLKFSSSRGLVCWPTQVVLLHYFPTSHFFCMDIFPLINLSTDPPDQGRSFSLRLTNWEFHYSIILVTRTWLHMKTYF